MQKNFVTKDSGKGREKFESGAVRDVREGKGRYDLVSPLALRRLAQLYERGANKYSERNWEKGMQFSRVLDSMKRHAEQYQEGDRSEDHLAAVAWNAFVLIHYEEMIERGLLPEDLDDLPDYINDGPEESSEVDVQVERLKAFLLHTSEGQTFCRNTMAQALKERMGVTFEEFESATDELEADTVGKCPACGGPVLRIPVQDE